MIFSNLLLLVLVRHYILRSQICLLTDILDQATRFWLMFSDISIPISKLYHLSIKLAQLIFLNCRPTPTIILIRHPADAISSNYLMCHETREIVIPISVNSYLLEILIQDYVDYYRYILKNANKIKLVWFEEMINKKDNVLQSLIQSTNLTYKDKKSIIEAFSSFKETKLPIKRPLMPKTPNRLKENKKRK